MEQKSSVKAVQNKPRLFKTMGPQKQDKGISTNTPFVTQLPIKKTSPAASPDAATNGLLTTHRAGQTYMQHRQISSALSVISSSNHNFTPVIILSVSG